MKNLLMVIMVLLAQLGFSQFPPDDKKFSMPEIPPQYVGGDEAMLKFINKNLSLQGEVDYTGTVYVSITTDTTGNVTKAVIVRGHPMINDEVLRVAKLLKFRPAKSSEAKPIEYSMVLPVKFVAK
jgi:protein TonB